MSELQDFADPIDDGYEPRPGLTHRDADWSGLRVLVAGLGISGFAAADALWERGAVVTVVDASAPGASRTVDERAQILAVLGVDVRLGPEHTAGMPSDRAIDLVVTSPGWRPTHPVLADAAAHGIPIWGEVELAWRMRAREGAAPWLTVTGTNGKTTTVNMLASILRAAGLRATSAGNVGTPLLEAVLHPQPYDVIAVELSSFQLFWQRSLSPVASACLNVAADHIDWHGSFEDYLRAKGRVFRNTHLACIYNVADPLTEQLVIDADVIEGCRAVGFTLGIPALSMVGLVDEILADRAFVEQRHHSAAELATIADVQGEAPSIAPHYLANALAAAALARAYGVGPLSVRDGLRAFRPDPHRIAEVGTVDGVRYVNDSKATNPHAAEAALASFDSVVWVAGGLLKGADIEALVEKVAGKLRGVVLIGADRALIAQALARHAPDVPVVDAGGPDTGGMQTTGEDVDRVMDRVVAHAATLARPGDVVLLAPAAASMDMFANYGERGSAFERAVGRFGERPGQRS
ncbi:MAG TPA: UDP-N-acetylmuramoyl-L-alanine--D-glutamate ligase [Dermatophilaceae bacterium]|nr:UDP-N-acetylmuramoyl-L-alanine--D-glutamate ligase [Dermatophilaceae bacterium]HOA00917.1 UDP-N-acetylmuramoyl-L-alanine--D-glutamate ligase [Dermatophilaceae bacterium]HOA57147.1 UDP-N-acetylmuramoyl-L-alanine--D-glutamate ligase [Dermatophilaceae bacterium]HOF35658.1 UDP-N-acetylmuramoyl-L-alanine--D-glutamate ligase [Dermatophilaceae bacterium]HOR14756.1 UDP-N-acetylmuramoyl-L-alanine--D-glutamate ligase [Dermatophilaceae bacterium]